MLRQLVVAALLLTACSKPEPPRIVPKEAQVTAVGPQGMQVLLKIEATNPNKMALSAQRMTGKAKLDGKYDMGTVTIDKPVVLPPSVPTMVEVPMTMPWADVSTMAALAGAPRPIPYVVDGTVTVGGDRINFDLPYTLTGTISREQIAGAALRAIPGLVPQAPR